jgi:hypothetical protein
VFIIIQSTNMEAKTYDNLTDEEIAGFVRLGNCVLEVIGTRIFEMQEDGSRIRLEHVK